MACRDRGKHKSRHHTNAKRASGAITPRSEYTKPEAPATPNTASGSEAAAK